MHGKERLHFPASTKTASEGREEIQEEGKLNHFHVTFSASAKTSPPEGYFGVKVQEHVYSDPKLTIYQVVVLETLKSKYFISY